MRGVRRTIGFALILLLLVQSVGIQVLAATDAPTRAIHVVYDDSGSMIRTNGKPMDTWCQAKYAMEVFAALMGEKDTLNIYVMSDYDNGAGTGASARLSLWGGDGQAANVAKIHNMITDAGDTPFDAVRKAYKDLVSASADEKWLVVLTDGDFQGISGKAGMNQFFSAKDSKVNVVFLAMGANVDTEKLPDAASSMGIYVEHAATSKDILGELTSISTRIFNSDRLDVNASTKTISFDVPMGELTIFAQGANVNIEGIQDSSGKTFLASTAPVNVQYSEVPTTNTRYKEYTIDRNLKGTVLTFRDDFPAGNYKLLVSGADTIEVYYKPNIEIAIFLRNSDGQEVTSLQNLKAGEYTVTFGFVKAGTGERINESKLLGNVTYSAVVTNNGTEQPITYESGSSGAKLYLDEGSLEIDALARYLEYNSVSSHLSYSIFEDKGAGLRVISVPDYEITKAGIDNAEPIQVQVTIDTIEITPEVWSAMGVPTVTLPGSETNKGYGEFLVEKSKTPGIYNIYPTLANGPMLTDLYQNCDFSLFFGEKHGESMWSGEGSGTVRVTDTRSWLDRYLRIIIKWTIIGILLLILAGYLPFIKPYLPRSLKKRPLVTAKPLVPGVATTNGQGRYRKKYLHTLIPYRAERATIRFVPRSVAGAPVMKVKALRGGGMEIVNTKSYAGQSHIRFNGIAVPKDPPHAQQITATTLITTTTKTIRYNCSLNQKG